MIDVIKKRKKKKPLIYSSLHQLKPFKVDVCFRAEWHSLYGLNPWLLSQNMGSYMASTKDFMATWTFLYLGEGTQRARICPLDWDFSLDWTPFEQVLIKMSHPLVIELVLQRLLWKSQLSLVIATWRHVTWVGLDFMICLN